MPPPWLTDVTGYLAAAIGTVLMLPQVIKSLKTRRVDDLSWLMLAAYVTQCVLWDVYGALISSVPLIACNTVALGIGTVQAVLKARYAPAEPVVAAR
jgi:MtN3 and saliva related transmembrane protein